jgi:hypothetical protein
MSEAQLKVYEAYQSIAAGGKRQAHDDIVHLMEVMQNAADMIKRADYTPARSLLLVELDKMKK